MKIVIVGGTSSLVDTLRPALSSFAEVLTAGRTGCDLKMDMFSPPEEFHLPDGIDVVVNLSANFGGGDFDGMLAAEQVNVLGLLKLCHACTRAEVAHLVQISSIFASLPEGSPFYGAYSLSKRHADEIARLYCDGFKLPLTILRFAQIYGVGESFRKHQPFLYSIFDKAQNNEEILFYGTRDAQRNLIHAEDVAKIVARVIQCRMVGLYNCPGPLNVRYSEIAKVAIAAFGSTSKFSFLPDKPDILDNPFFDDAPLYSLINYSPCISIGEGIAKEVARRKVL